MDHSHPRTLEQTSPAQPGARLAPAPTPAPAPAPACAALRLVSAQLRLAMPSRAPGDEWQRALGQLALALDLKIDLDPPARAHALRQMAKWASVSAGEDAPVVFEPWRIRSPVEFGDPARIAALPQARWVVSYLHDTGGGRPAAQRSVDLMLASPHPDACRIDADCGYALPGLDTIRAMIEAVRAQGRKRLVIITHERSRNAMARRLLACDQALTRAGLELDVCSIEDAILHLPRGAPAWDAAIVLPELRSLVFALIVRAVGVTAPWPMLWHDRGLRRITGEALDRRDGALDATLLAQSLALAARDAGAGHAARALHAGWAGLRERGLVTPTRGSAAPYTNEVSEAELVDLICTAVQERSGSGDRPAPVWQALGGSEAARPEQPRAALSLVTSR